MIRQGNLDRKTMLQLLGAGSAAVAGGAPLLASADSDVSQIAKYIGPIDEAHAAKGLAYDLGATLPLTGYAAYYGQVMSQGMKLAASHIAALGGPNLNIIYKDDKGGDPQAGVTAARELGLAPVGAMLASYVADLGAMVPGIAQYKIFTLDGGGGVGVFEQSKPYFYGSIAITPNDALPGVAKYIREKLPSVKRISSVGWDIGPATQLVTNQIKSTFSGSGLTIGAIELTKIGQTDYANTIQKVKEDKPDLVILSIYGDDTGYFIKQYATSGINKPLFIFTHTAGAAKIAGPAYDGVYLAFDFFDAQNPPNGWAKIFVDEYQKAYNVAPDYYAANYYEDTFVIWDLIRRVLAKGGNPKDGEQLDKAFRLQPWFPSLYGGSPGKAGTLSFDLETHDVKRRQMTVSVWKNQKARPLAYFNINGADFRIA